LVAQGARESHHHARSTRDQLYNNLRIVLVDGTKIIIPRTDETIEEYSLGSGSTGPAYYPQIHAGGFFDLTTGTFSDMNFDHGQPKERAMMLEHAQKTDEPTLYIGDAGYNGMAHVYLMSHTGHHLLMELKQGKIVKDFLASKKRSRIVTITITKDHLKNYPDYRHLQGRSFKVRLIRTRGTTKLRSRVLLTTLLDETLYKWYELTKLYLQRWRIELAFRHLKKSIKIEHIRKCSLHRIKQLLWAAIILFNLSCIIRNTLKLPSLFPEKEKVKIYCFEYILQLSELFFLAAIKLVKGMKKEMIRRLKVMKQCWFFYQPWRIRPRICQFPSSVFTRQKSTAIKDEFEKCDAIKNDMRILGMKYGQIEAEIA